MNSHHLLQHLNQDFGKVRTSKKYTYSNQYTKETTKVFKKKVELPVGNMSETLLGLKTEVKSLSRVSEHFCNFYVRGV